MARLKRKKGGSRRVYHTAAGDHPTSPALSQHRKNSDRPSLSSSSFTDREREREREARPRRQLQHALERAGDLPSFRAPSFAGETRAHGRRDHSSRARPTRHATTPRALSKSLRGISVRKGRRRSSVALPACDAIRTSASRSAPKPGGTRRRVTRSRPAAAAEATERGRQGHRDRERERQRETESERTLACGVRALKSLGKEDGSMRLSRENLRCQLRDANEAD